MSRPLSQLIYTRIQATDASPLVITLHGHNQHGNTPAALGLAAAPAGRVIGLESYKGVYIGRTVVGYTWYIGPLDQPAPVFFGDALSQIERFLWDELNRQDKDAPERPFLVGIEQGAVMAIAAALAAPDLVSGVIAVDGALPVVPGWDPPLAPIDGLPFLLVGDLAVQSDAPVLRRDTLAAQLSRWGATATWRQVADDAELDALIADWLAKQSPRFGYPASDQ